MHRIKECSPIHFRENFRNDWKACATASYFSHLFTQITPYAAYPNNTDYQQLNAILDQLNEEGISFPAFIHTELNILENHGHRPQLNHCTYCQNKTVTAFSIEKGSVLCAACAKDHNDGKLIYPSSASLNMLRQWQTKLTSHPRTTH